MQSDIDDNNLDSTVLFWPSNDWNAGDLSRSTGSNPRPARISAFSIIDTIFHRLVEKYINLEKIVFTGHSAGSQMVVRYAAGGRAQNNILQEQEIEFLYVTTNTPSFLYLDSLRVVDEYTVPYQFEYSTNCGTANYYKYGLYNMNDYMNETGVFTIRNNYLSRKIVYLIGEFDIGGLSNNCARSVQGENRLFRSYIFFSYLGAFYSESVYQNHRLSEIPNAYHNFEDMVFSDCGYSVYFRLNTEQCNYVDPEILNNFSPIADAGEDQTADFGTIVMLDGSNSSDPDGSLNSFSWSQIMGLPVTIDSSTQAIASFVAPTQETILRFVLEVTDNTGTSSTDTIDIDLVSLSTQGKHNDKKESTITIFPNPFNNITTITLKKYSNDEAPVWIYDVVGRKVFLSRILSQLVENKLIYGQSVDTIHVFP